MMNKMISIIDFIYTTGFSLIDCLKARIKSKIIYGGA